VGSLTLLRNEQAISLLQGNTMSRVFVIWRESSRMRRFSNLSAGNLLECVDAHSIGVERVHEMHLD
jgi:hypothetical protein